MTETEHVRGQEDCPASQKLVRRWAENTRASMALAVRCDTNFCGIVVFIPPQAQIDAEGDSTREAMVQFFGAPLNTAQQPVSSSVTVGQVDSWVALQAQTAQFMASYSAA